MSEYNRKESKKTNETSRRTIGTVDELTKNAFVNQRYVHMPIGEEWKIEIEK